MARGRSHGAPGTSCLFKPTDVEGVEFNINRRHRLLQMVQVRSAQDRDYGEILAQKVRQCNLVRRAALLHGDLLSKGHAGLAHGVIKSLARRLPAGGKIPAGSGRVCHGPRK